ncbi:ABC transporter ATP-binding protein [Marinomonas transparens]|uniref:ABC transporter ATP-binding protein n=1 Tax=Marinomonas transparens TaxID=2795388 RepID=A0A934JVH8_9GAMM|nr:ATP-binding cassette domain-containing protein [Marinomonas transparens]MBJ7539042.1 ABC transporter ATP-binding protein [Marinomonas transparens]
MTILLKLTNVAVYAGDSCLLEPISLSLVQGRPLTILGQTGSGKSLLAQAVMGLLPEELALQGEIEVLGESMTCDERRALWGTKLVMLPQEPWNALDPLMKGVDQVQEVYRYVHGKHQREAMALAQADLQYVGLAHSGAKRPSQLSGGMAQRLAIAAATAGGASLILADEPTKGLDASRRLDIVRLLQTRSAMGGLLTITHDVAIARQLGGDILVIKAGRLVEQGDAQTVLSHPEGEYTQALLGAEPRVWKEASFSVPLPESPEVVLNVEKLSIERGGKSLFNDLSFQVKQGEVVGIVGESGCGKSSLGDALLGLLPVASGRISRLIPAAQPYQWLKLYQDPPSAVTSSVTLGKLLEDLVGLHGIDRGRIAPMMDKLSLPEVILERSCHGVSGGELQRFAILRALLLNPVFLFADEPTSRLDPITAKEVTTLLFSLARETKCAVLLVSHDADLVRKTCDQVIAL